MNSDVTLLTHWILNLIASEMVRFISIEWNSLIYRKTLVSDVLAIDAPMLQHYVYIYYVIQIINDTTNIDALHTAHTHTHNHHMYVNAHLL